jgi:hypothetical protein
MPFLDASALYRDPDGLRFLTCVLAASGVSENLRSKLNSPGQIASDRGKSSTGQQVASREASIADGALKITPKQPANQHQTNTIQITAACELRRAQIMSGSDAQHTFDPKGDRDAA